MTQHYCYIVHEKHCSWKTFPKGAEADVKPMAYLKIIGETVWQMFTVAPTVVIQCQCLPTDDITPTNNRNFKGSLRLPGYAEAGGA